jgi:hypothetical protein
MQAAPAPRMRPGRRAWSRLWDNAGPARVTPDLPKGSN